MAMMMGDRAVETVPIVLVGGPLDGETHPIPVSEAGRIARAYVPPLPLSVFSLLPEGAVPEMPKHLHYKPMIVGVGGWLAPSVGDDGVMRYEYAGEW